MDLKIQDFANVKGLRVKIIPALYKKDEWVATIESEKNNKSVELKQSPNIFFGIPTGYGSTPDVAIDHLCKNIQGRVLVLNAESENDKQEIPVPSNLSW